MWLWPRTQWQRSRPHRQKVERVRQHSTLLPICCQFRQQSTVNEVNRVEFNFVTGVYRALELKKLFSSREITEIVALSYSIIVIFIRRKGCINK